MKAENKFSWFGASNKFEEAGELYSKAANQYKVAKKSKSVELRPNEFEIISLFYRLYDHAPLMLMYMTVKEAGDAYMLAAESYMKGKCGHDGATNYIHASKAYRKISAKGWFHNSRARFKMIS
tara:strand:+ start:408 stop:776 length:369 start_codon:yes stop_codon:yes gene_type:complete